MPRYVPDYDHIFIEYLGRRDRLSEISSIKLGSAQETDNSDFEQCVWYLLKGEPKDGSWHCVMWADGGQMLWDIIGEATSVLHAYTPDELEIQKEERLNREAKES